MADDYQTNAGTGGKTFHSRQVSSVDYPVGLVGWGSVGGPYNEVDSASGKGLPVQPCTGATWAVTGTFYQATQPVSIATLPALAAGTAVIGHVVVDSAPTTAVTGTFWQTTQPVSGTVTANAGTGTFTITGAVTQSGTWNVGTVTTVTGVTTVTTVSTVTSLSQWAGNAIDTNSGSKSAGTLRVVLATDQPALTNKLLVTPDANSAVNISQMNGVTVTMGNGASGTGVQRVTIASDSTGIIGATQSGTWTVGLSAAQTLATVTTVSTVTNLSQLGGNAIAMGTGARSSGTQRVTIATDDVVPASQSGTWTVQPGNTPNSTPWLVTDTPATSGGLSFNYQIAPATPAKTAVKASAGMLYAIKAMNIGATPVYIKLFNVASASVTLGTTACDDQYIVPGNTAGAGFVMNVDKGIAFGTAITAAITGGIASADNTSITASNVVVTFYYK